jgi:hypothetical protein
MSLFRSAFREAVFKNIWVILGVTCLATAWLIEKNAIQLREKEIESKRLIWDQYRVDNNMYSLISSKFETMRLIDIATSNLSKDSATKTKILLQLRFALFDQLRLRIETDEAVYLLEKDPLDEDTSKMLIEKRIEITKAFNSGDINKLLLLHERDNDYSFNNTEKRTKQYVQDFNELLKRHEKAEYFYLFLYILGSVLVVYQKINDTIRHEKESLEDQHPKSKSARKK